MFKSKGFTITFSILSVILIALIVFFCYLVFGKGAEKILTEGHLVETIAEETTQAPQPDTTPAETETTEETTTTAAETTKAPTDKVTRPLNADDDRKYPVVNEVIPETGVITIIKSGDAGEGIVFHAKPQFDDANAEGNISNYDGSYNIAGKIYILNNGKPFLLYKTEDGYYCTSSPVYMSYAASQTTIAPDASKVGVYGESDDQSLLVEVFSDDGNHVVFSIYNYDKAEGAKVAVLENVVAEYGSNGIANFEYHYEDGYDHTGTISFETPADGSAEKRVDIVLEVPMKFRTGETNEVVLHK